MIHYHVWFNLKADVPEAHGLSTVAQFLKEVCAADEAANFQLLRNQGAPPRSHLPRFHALIQFVDESQLAHAMRRQTGRGIHSGLHGEIVDFVADFHVELFSTLETPTVLPTFGLQSCEI